MQVSYFHSFKPTTPDTTLQGSNSPCIAPPPYSTHPIASLIPLASSFVVSTPSSLSLLTQHTLSSVTSALAIIRMANQITYGFSTKLAAILNARAGIPQIFWYKLGLRTFGPFADEVSCFHIFYPTAPDQIPQGPRSSCIAPTPNSASPLASCSNLTCCRYPLIFSTPYPTHPLPIMSASATIRKAYQITYGSTRISLQSSTAYE
jgi:hypothetical protein